LEEILSVNLISNLTAVISCKENKLDTCNQRLNFENKCIF